MELNILEINLMFDRLLIRTVCWSKNSWHCTHEIFQIVHVQYFKCVGKVNQVQLKSYATNFQDFYWTKMTKLSQRNEVKRIEINYLNYTWHFELSTYLQGNSHPLSIKLRIRESLVILRQPTRKYPPAFISHKAEVLPLLRRLKTPPIFRYRTRHFDVC